MSAYTSWEGALHFNDWAGRRSYPVTVVGETPKKYRIRAEVVSFKHPSAGIVKPGDVVLVPKYAVTRDEGIWSFPHRQAMRGCPACDMDTNSPCGFEPEQNVRPPEFPQ